MSSEPPIDADALNGLAAASDEEAAAIVAAISDHIQTQEAAAAAAAAADADSEEASRRSWQFTGRLSGVGITATRPSSSTPSDGWTAADRADRF